jgi:hypothetical protein
MRVDASNQFRERAFGFLRWLQAICRDDVVERLAAVDDESVVLLNDMAALTVSIQSRNSLSRSPLGKVPNFSNVGIFSRGSALEVVGASFVGAGRLIGAMALFAGSYRTGGAMGPRFGVVGSERDSTMARFPCNSSMIALASFRSRVRDFMSSRIMSARLPSSRWRRLSFVPRCNSTAPFRFGRIVLRFLQVVVSARGFRFK